MNDDLAETGTQPELGSSATGPGLRYRPLFPLGEGGMAKVLLAVGRGPGGFNKLVVLKAMRRELVGDDELRQMFLAEARLSARLNNANVVQVYQVVDTAVPCIVMEYLEGQPLSALYDRTGERFTLVMQLKVLSESLSGLHYSHELRDYDGTPLNIVHRDISPQNIFVTYDGVVKVLDFGIAKGAGITGHTRTGVLKGKIRYMPREQLLNESIDRRADIYAAGCMLWRAAAGTLLWAGKPEGDVMRAVIEGRLPKPSEVREVDPRLEAIVMKAMAPEPADRYSTALELQSAIDEFMHAAYPPTSMRAVGELVSSAFSEERRKRQEEIKTALEAPPSDAPPPNVPDGLQNLIHFTPTGVTTVLKTNQANNRRKIWMPIAAVLGLTLLAFGGWFVGMKSQSEQAQPAPSAKATAPQVEVRIAVKPEGATATVDGQVLAENPSTLTVSPDSRDHEIRVSKAGYEPYLRTARFDRNLTIEITLQPLPAPAAPTSPPDASAVTSKAPQKWRPTTAAPKQPKNDCDPPFYFDGRIKKYKPGCL